MKFYALNHQKVKTISLKLLCNEYLSLFVAKIFFLYIIMVLVLGITLIVGGVEHCVCSVKIYDKK